MIAVEVKKTAGESTASLMRRFSKRVQSGGYIKKAKSIRYHLRGQSTLAKKKFALKRLTKLREIEWLKKIGKLNDSVPRKSH